MTYQSHFAQAKVEAQPLFPYQEDGAAYLAARPRAGLFDEPGVGKTAQAIRACDLTKAMHILIVCPAAVRQVWIGEFRKFSTIPRRILKGKDINDLNLFLKGKCHVLIVSYEMAAKWAKKLEGDLIDVIILDEAHYAKSPHALRTRALYGAKCDGLGGLCRWGVHVWALTGTPMPNDPIDIWPWLRFVGATGMNLRPFTDRYFKVRAGTYGTRQTPRPETVPELKQTIKAFSMRRTKEQAGLQLPPIFLTTQTIEGDTAAIRELMRDFPGLEKSIVDAVEKGGLSFLDAQHIATLRRLVGEAKAPAFIDLISQELDNGLEKVAIFGLHVRALGMVAEALGSKGYGVVTINGSTPERQRVDAVEKFQSGDAGSPRVFIGNIRAAGTGLTLTAAADVVMLESSWAPADNAQALMRCHRIGQTKTVRARFISLANSIDQTVVETVARKTSAIAMSGGFEMQAMA